MSYAAPVFVCLFGWWFSTGALIYLNNLPPRTFPWSVGTATALLFLSFLGLYAVRNDTTAGGAYLGFVCGLVAWAWTQLTFYTGTITGPRRSACPRGCGGIRHFLHAVETCIYHEMAAVAVGAAIMAASWGGKNECGASVYVILWIMHSSAKVNAVLGIRNLNAEFFPPRLKYLRSFLRRRAINPLFPFSVTGGAIAAAMLMQNAGKAVTSYELTSALLLGTMMALAVIEHWLLLLPIPAAALWVWGLRARKADPDRIPVEPRKHAEIGAGSQKAALFLGSQ